MPEGVNISGANARPAIRLSSAATIGDHGIAVMSQREGLKFSVPVKSDCAPLNKLVAEMLEASSNITACATPPAAAWPPPSTSLPSSPGGHQDRGGEAYRCMKAVRAACELLGFDPLYVANEGKLVAMVAAGGCRKGAGRRCSEPVRHRSRYHRRGGARAPGPGGNEDQTGRVPHRGYARRRAAAADMLGN